MENTSEFSFILKPSNHGIGVFTTHDIQKGSHLRLFGDNEMIDLRFITHLKKDVPHQFQEYCMDRGNKIICPEDFGSMHIGWYLNHSKDFNAFRDEDFKWYASRDIKSGEEIVIDYNSLEEPMKARDDYYGV
jgi:hypothetical protein